MGYRSLDRGPKLGEGIPRPRDALVTSSPSSASTRRRPLPRSRRQGLTGARPRRRRPGRRKTASRSAASWLRARAAARARPHPSTPSGPRPGLATASSRGAACSSASASSRACAPVRPPPGRPPRRGRRAPQRVPARMPPCARRCAGGHARESRSGEPPRGAPDRRMVSAPSSLRTPARACGPLRPQRARHRQHRRDRALGGQAQLERLELHRPPPDVLNSAVELVELRQLDPTASSARSSSPRMATYSSSSAIRTVSRGRRRRRTRCCGASRAGHEAP